MKEIVLTREKTALVDDEDFEELNKYKWCTYSGPWGCYAVRALPRSGGKHRIVRMHRSILDAPDGIQVDHINHNTLDNRRENLRLCTNLENSRNRISIRGSSRYKGVGWHKQRSKWRAYIKVNGKDISLGLFTKEVDAAVVYNNAAIEHFGEFANLNEVA